MILPMIGIYSKQHLAIALWNSAERAFEREQLTEHGKEHSAVPWDRAHELDRQEYLHMAQEIIDDCRKQAEELCK